MTLDPAWAGLVVQGVMALGVIGGGGAFFVRVARQDERRATNLRGSDTALHLALDAVVAGLGEIRKQQEEANKLFRDHERICDEFRGGVTADLRRVVENSGKVDALVTELAVAKKDVETIKDNIDWGTAQFENIARQLGEVGRRLGVVYAAPETPRAETPRRPPAGRRSRKHAP